MPKYFLFHQYFITRGSKREWKFSQSCSLEETREKNQIILEQIKQKQINFDQYLQSVRITNFYKIQAQGVGSDVFMLSSGTRVSSTGLAS